MDNIETINSKYAEAVKGIQAQWLISSGTEWYDYILELPDILRTTYLVSIFESQQYNGGLHQYFTNKYGQFCANTIEALRVIHAHERAQILSKAYSIVKPHNWTDEEFRVKLLVGDIPNLFINDAFFDPLDELDESYNNLDSEFIDELLASYIKYS